MKKTLIVVDMQNDFIDGALGTQEAEAIVPAVLARMQKAREEGETVICTRDTHGADYLQTQEGRKLPVAHCIQGTKGWEVREELKPFIDETIDKPSFGSVELPKLSAVREADELTLIGLCTDICVISNAMLLKAFYPEKTIRVEAACCAGVTPQSHETALRAMQACQIEIV